MKIGIVGCAGRMGRMLMAEVIARPDAELAGGAERSGHEAVGQDLGVLAGLDSLGISAGDDVQALFAAADAVIDFTAPAATAENARIAADQATAFIVGTTGLDDAQQAAIVQASEKTAIVQAANMSLGVNVLLGLTRQVSATLGDDYDIEIVEMHHRHKVDAPSGTALALGRAAAEGRGVALDDVAQKVRDGHTGERVPGDIGFATLRGGDVVGDHTVVFSGPGERIELTHRAASRVLFARGAVTAALWAEGRAPGHYSMADVLDLS